MLTRCFTWNGEQEGRCMWITETEGGGGVFDVLKESTANQEPEREEVFRVWGLICD